MATRLVEHTRCDGFGLLRDLRTCAVTTNVIRTFDARLPLQLLVRNARTRTDANTSNTHEREAAQAHSLVQRSIDRTLDKEFANGQNHIWMSALVWNIIQLVTCAPVLSHVRATRDARRLYARMCHEVARLATRLQSRSVYTIRTCAT